MDDAHRGFSERSMRGCVAASLFSTIEDELIEPSQLVQQPRSVRNLTILLRCTWSTLADRYI